MVEARALLDVSTLLSRHGFDPASVLVIRHAPREPALKRILPWLAAERPELFLAWQQIQLPTAEKAMTRAKWVAAFVGQSPGHATFAGLNRIIGWTQLDYQGYLDFPGNAELFTFGMTPRGQDDPAPLAFELQPDATFDSYRGRLIVRWPKPDQTWSRWAANSVFEVVALSEDNRFERGMPSWEQLVLSWVELKALPSSWRAALSQWRGVYYIFDQASKTGYVGSAGGGENLLGRWRGYGETGHGDNVALRTLEPGDLQFSILQRTSPDMPMAELVALEATWKLRLHTRAGGLNRN